MKKHAIVLSIVLLSAFPKLISAAPLEKPASWPEKIDKRNCFCKEDCYIYAKKKSQADKTYKMIRKVYSEFKDEPTIRLGKGLIICFDYKEEPILDIERLLTILASQQKQEGQSENKINDVQDNISDMKKEFEEVGLDIQFIFSIVPLPIEPNMLSDVLQDFESIQLIEKQIDWCLILPTDKNIKEGTKKLIKAMLKEKVKGGQKLLLIPMMPFVENKMINQMKKSRQLMVYQTIMELQTDLENSVREKRIQDYEVKIGLKEKD
ncbi:MAG: hypothetical protein ACYTET_01840 [Planctomycetota bacterium]|jgi:hypothetical protein